MNTSAVEKIANAVLYEGYMLYPYRPSALKNRQRFNFGVLYPRDYCELEAGSDAWEMRTECLVVTENAESAMIEVSVRFLQMAAREEWQDGLERVVTLPAATLQSSAGQALRHEFVLEPSRDAEGRCCERLVGEAELSTSQLAGSVFKLTLNIRNRTEIETTRETTRDQALMRSFVSVHSILQATGGEFVSLLDPPEDLKGAVAECHSAGTFPVMAGIEGQRGLMLSSPIILYDYPQVAPESAGDLFDGTEIDEILALRILTMTQEEKLEVRNGDDRARQILERTEMMPPEHFQKLHGALRGMRVKPEGLL
ncbi:MAG TPA: hypothetical protein VG273_18755 [Bryobacteraceae bacterium]|jgi:hydrogenase maturation protease|nr:hypothetical protein [Bryobacteraceae bacterium]